MANPITSILESVSSPATGLLNAAKGILDKFIASPDEKAKATIELLEANNAFTLEMAKLDVTNYQTQASVIITEAKSESWLTSNWRPLVAVAFAAGCIMALVYVLFGTVRLDQKDLVMTIALEFLGITKICLGGYYFGRTWEKSGPQTVAAWRGKKSDG
jgi:hypothetical protein